MREKLLPIVKPKQTFKQNMLQWELDIREYGEINTPAEIHKMIVASVLATQHPIMLELPSWIIMTHRQFVNLLPYTAEMEFTTDRIYVTPYNVMEVDVDVDTDHVDQDEVLLTEAPEVEAFEQPAAIPSGGRWSR